MIKSYFSPISVFLIIAAMTLTASMTNGQQVPFTVCPVCGGQIEYVQDQGDQFHFNCLNENKVYYGYSINGNGFYSTNPIEPVTLTIYVRDGENGPIIPGVQFAALDGLRNSIQGTTNSNGYVTVTGYPGTWSYTASADGYLEEKSYDGVGLLTQIWEVDLQKVETQQEPVATTPSSEPVFGDNQQQQESVPTTTPQGSESSVVGKWAFHVESEAINGPSDPAHYHDHQTWDDVIDFNNDGTFTGTGDFAGKWVQSGNTIRLQNNPSPEVEQGDNCKIWEAEGDNSYEGTINGDSMSGTGVTGFHGSGLCSDRSWPNQWSASRVGTGDSGNQ